MQQCAYSGQAVWPNGTTGYMANDAEQKTTPHITANFECVCGAKSVTNVKNLTEEQLGAFMLRMGEKR